MTKHSICCSRIYFFWLSTIVIIRIHQISPFRLEYRVDEHLACLQEIWSHEKINLSNPAYYSSDNNEGPSLATNSYISDLLFFYYQISHISD